MVARVLVVEDDSTVSSVLSAYLSKEGFEQRVAADGATALREWTQWKPDVVILDVMLPGMTGLEVLQRRRAEDDAAAVIILSALVTRRTGCSASRWVPTTKWSNPSVHGRPFCASRRCCAARNDWVGAGSKLPRTVAVRDLLVDLRARTAQLRGETLTHREFDLLAYLMTHRDEAFTKEALMRRVWGWDFGDTSTVTVHVRRLLEKIELDPSDPRPLLTVRGTGYRFDGQEGS